MLKALYSPGDTIQLRPRAMVHAQPDGAGVIVSVMPASTQGAVVYRVCFRDEKFERSISQDDIDTVASPATPRGETGAPSRAAGSSWINSNKIRTRK